MLIDKDRNCLKVHRRAGKLNQNSQIRVLSYETNIRITLIGVNTEYKVQSGSLIMKSLNMNIRLL